MNVDSFLNELEKIKYEKDYILLDKLIIHKLDSFIYLMKVPPTKSNLNQLFGPKIKIEETDSLHYIIIGGYNEFILDFYNEYKDSAGNCGIYMMSKKGIFPSKRKSGNKMIVKCQIGTYEFDYFFNCLYWYKYLEPFVQYNTFQVSTDRVFMIKKSVIIPETILKIWEERKRNRHY